MVWLDNESKEIELQSNQLTVDISCPLIKVANEFVNNQPTRQHIFGKFTDIFIQCLKNIFCDIKIKNDLSTSTPFLFKLNYFRTPQILSL